MLEFDEVYGDVCKGGSLTGLLTWLLFGIPCRDPEKFFILHVNLAFLEQYLHGANLNLDINYNIFILGMG